VTAPLPCGPTPDDARVALDGFEVIVRPCYTVPYWDDSTHDSHEFGRNASAIRPAWLVCPGHRPPRRDDGDPARVALRRPDAETRDRTEETR
jgi:hypothetical protein